MKLGIDFGSTYTTVSVYDEDKNICEALLLGGMNSPCIPSIVSMRNNSMEYGVLAKNQTGKKNTRIFKGFKMMLQENRPDILEKRGFDLEKNPVEIARFFLEKIIEAALNKYGDDTVERLVIGAPEVWFSEIKTISGRGVLRDICSGIPAVNSEGVTIVSEPACASAFFAHNYRTITKKPFDGHILLIDYGGGTLDINLTRISAGDIEDGQQYLEIKVIESNGAGENTEGKIGQAGILYMESAAELALRKAGLWDDGQGYDGKFQRLVNEIEEALIGSSVKIKTTFEMYDDDLDELEEIEFTVLEYDDEELSVTYATLLEAYNNTIRDTLSIKLQEMKRFINDNNIDQDSDHFKIALVGGFGNFYLVKRQVQEEFDNFTQDKKMGDILVNEDDREKAISFGASLFASDIVGVRQTAPYSFGMYSETMNGSEAYYAFKYKQDIEYYQPYYISYENGENIIFCFNNNKVDQFAINMSYDEKNALKMTPTVEFKDRLTNLIRNNYKTASIGFSLDSSEILSMHIREFDMENNQFADKPHVVELANIGDLFGSQRVEHIYK